MADNKQRIANKLFKDGRVNFMTKADYSEGSKIDNIMKDILNKIAINNKIDEYSK